MTSTNDVPNASFYDKDALDEKIARIRDLNEKVIEAAKDAGRVSIDAYEMTLESLVEFEQKVAGNSQLDWVTALAKTHAQFVQDVSSFFVSAARDNLK